MKAPAERAISDTKEKGHGGTLLLALLAVPLVYVLSTGPMMKFGLHMRMPPFIERVYIAPCVAAYDHVPLASSFFDWYLDQVWNIDGRAK
jgi:hypothetical protein